MKFFTNPLFSSSSFARFVGVCVFAWLSSAGWAAIYVHEFDTEEKNDRFQGLVHELRCPKCQNQNLAESNSAISIDLRDQVAKLVSEGQSDAEVKEYMVQRYGEFVLYKPPVENSTLVLWLAPAVMLLLAMLVFVFVVYRRSHVTNAVDDETDAVTLSPKRDDIASDGSEGKPGADTGS